MTRDELEHAIRAACDVAEDTEVFVFGSQAILGEHPDAPEALLVSAEADIAPKNKPEKVDDVDGALGELSPFHREFGFYVHGVPLESATMPDGWRDRVIAVRNENTRQCTGWCVEVHDLAASKLNAFRDKDRTFVRVLLIEGLVQENELISRIASLPIPQTDRERWTSWVRSTCLELRS